MDPRMRYHQPESEALQPSTSRPSIVSSIAGTILLIYLLNAVLQYFDAPILPLQQYLWNAIVYITPTPFLLDSARRQELKANGMLSQTHAAKSDSLRRMLGLGGHAILQSLPNAGEAIGLGSVSRRLSMAAGMVKPAVTSGAPPGLGNWDNSCYQNSVLQALASLGGLRDWLRTAEPPQSGEDSTTNTALQQLLARLSNEENNGKHIWTPAKLKNMSSWQQQDAQEYFSKIMDELDREAKRAFGAVENKPGLETIAKKGEEQETSKAKSQADLLRNPLEGLVAQRVACTSCGFSEGYSMIPFNCLTVPLGPKFAYNLEECLDEYTKSEDIEGVECRSCTLMHAAEKLQKMIAAPPTPLKVLATPILDVPVDDADISERAVQIPATSLSPSAMVLPPELRAQIFGRLQAIEQALDEDDFSDKTVKQTCAIPTKAFVSATKSREAVIGRAPQSLVIHINRSVFDEMTGMQRKNYAHVHYPMLLDPRPWMLEIGNEPPQYQLSAVVQHYGRHENGHYICYRRHPGIPPLTDDEPNPESCGLDSKEEQWWRLSDEDVSSVSEQEVLDQSGAFMLFYERLPVPEISSQMLEETLEAASIPLPPDEAADWDMISTRLPTEATPSLVTSSTQSVISESDVETELDERGPEAVLPSAGKLPLVPNRQPAMLKTASPAVMAHQDDMKVMNRMMRV